MSEYSESNDSDTNAELVDAEPIEDDPIVVDEDEEVDSKNGSVNVTKEFQENVIKFVKIDDLIRKKTTEMAELKGQKKPLETFILKYLDQVNETIVEITNGKLRKNKAESKAPINIEIIKEAIEKKVKDPKIVEDILKTMEDLRPKTVRVNLKRTSQRDEKTKTKTKVKRTVKKA